MNLTPLYALEQDVFVVVDSCIVTATVFSITASGGVLTPSFDYVVYTPNATTNVTRYKKLSEEVVFDTESGARAYLANLANTGDLCDYLPD